MFTGIITHLGKLTFKGNFVFSFSTDPTFCKKLSIGTSVSVNGVCLTVFNKTSKNSFSAEVMPETENKTTLGQIKIDTLVNLELPATLSTFLSGHIVQGHIDGVSKLLDIKLFGNSQILKFSASLELAKYIAKKGSIAINGISLTVIEAKKDHFTVGIVPFTWKNTMLHILKIGDLVNIETDILAKYTERLLK